MEQKHPDLKEVDARCQHVRPNVQDADETDSQRPKRIIRGYLRKFASLNSPADVAEDSEARWLVYHYTVGPTGQGQKRSVTRQGCFEDKYLQRGPSQLSRSTHPPSSSVLSILGSEHSPKVFGKAQAKEQCRTRYQVGGLAIEKIQPAASLEVCECADLKTVAFWQNSDPLQSVGGTCRVVVVAVAGKSGRQGKASRS